MRRSNATIIFMKLVGKVTQQNYLISRGEGALTSTKRSTVLAAIAIKNTMNTMRFVSEYAWLNLHMRSRILCKRGRAEGFGYYAPTRHIQAQFL